MSQVIRKERLNLTEAELQQHFLPAAKSLTLNDWLDPDRYPSMGIFNVEDAYEFLPNLYQALADNMEKDADWRHITSQVVTHNERADKNLQQWIRAAKLTVNQSKEAFYSTPFIPGMLNEKLGTPPKNTLWSFYSAPLLLTKRPVREIALPRIYRRKLDYSELYSRKYSNMTSEFASPPVIVVSNDELANPDEKAFTLIEGAFRSARADEAGKTHVACKIIPWQEVEPYIHIQPVKGGYHYQLPDFSVTQEVYI